jgi:hypothetical protein
MYQKPTILIQDHTPRLIIEPDCHDGDMYYYPSTPPLSASGSVINSPSSCDILPTPMNTMFFGFEGVKEGCEGEVQSENLAGGEWARCGSPPMTPGTFNLLYPIPCYFMILQRIRKGTGHFTWDGCGIWFGKAIY